MRTNNKEEYNIKYALKDYKISGSSLRKATAENNGYYPIESDNSGTKTVLRIVFSIYFRKEITERKVIPADKVIEKLSEFTSGKKSISFINKISYITNKPYRNLNRLISDYKSKNKKGLLIGFKIYKDLPENYLLPESKLSNI